MALILLDTEGIGGLESDDHYDTRIFSLATLLCSTLMYNSLGSIDENAISKMSFIAQLTQNIRIRQNGSNLDASGRFSEGGRFSDGGSPNGFANLDDDDALEFHRFFPSFVWVRSLSSLSLSLIVMPLATSSD